jgi:nucleoside-diphosphate-sugar epimerase
MFVDDCVFGIDQIMHCDKLIATPINLGTSELVSINQLVDYIEEIAGIKMERKYVLDAPRGVAGRNSDNTIDQSDPGLGAKPATQGRVEDHLSVDRGAVR